MNHVKKLFSNAMRTDISRGSSDVEDANKILSREEKIECVLRDPKFGMFSLMSMCDQLSGIYCSKTFSALCALPVCVFVAQWAMFIGIVAHKMRTTEEWCPHSADADGKIVMIGISLLYFVNSFFQFDNIVSRRRQSKRYPSDNVLVLLDAFQEYSFNLSIYVANLFIIYTTPDVVDMLFNSLAMEFVASLDNEFERTFFAYHPSLAVDIYDRYFVTAAESRALRKKRKGCFKVCLWVTWVPFKLLIMCFMLLPVFCAGMVVFGAVCK